MLNTSSTPICFKMKFYEDWVWKLNQKIEFFFLFLPSTRHQNYLDKSLVLCITCAMQTWFSYKHQETQLLFILWIKSGKRKTIKTKNKEKKNSFPSFTQKSQVILKSQPKSCVSSTASLFCKSNREDLWQKGKMFYEKTFWEISLWKLLLFLR